MSYSREIRKVISEKGWKELSLRTYYHLRRKIMTYGDFKFDLKCRVDTCGQKSILNLDIDDSLKSTSISYEPSPVKVIRSVLDELSINHSEFTFIDFGSGKGRVILLASHYPYKKIIGVELSPSLHEIAKNNIASYKNNLQRCFNIESIAKNAIEFDLPREPLVLFFFTPFHGHIFEQVIDNIENHLKTNKLRILIIYYGGNHDNIDRILKLNFTSKRIQLKRSFFQTGKYEAYLFSNPII